MPSCPYAGHACRHVHVLVYSCVFVCLFMPVTEHQECGVKHLNGSNTLYVVLATYVHTYVHMYFLDGA